jgi:ketosteroid isomerase-like protein
VTARYAPLAEGAQQAGSTNPVFPVLGAALSVVVRLFGLRYGVNVPVVVFGFESGTVKATGGRFRNEWAQKYVVRSGLITEMEEYNIQVSALE